MHLFSKSSENIFHGKVLNNNDFWKYFHKIRAKFVAFVKICVRENEYPQVNYLSFLSWHCINI